MLLLLIYPDFSLCFSVSNPPAQLLHTSSLLPHPPYLQKVAGYDLFSEHPCCFFSYHPLSSECFNGLADCLSWHLPGHRAGNDQAVILHHFYQHIPSLLSFFLSNTRGTLSSQRVSIIMCVPGFNPQRDGEERIEFQLLLSEDDNPSVQGINDITKIDL